MRRGWATRWTGRLARRVVGWYPRRWRDRYADEVLEVLDQHQITARTVFDLAANAAATRWDPAYRQDRSALMNRLRSGASVVAAIAVALAALAGWRLIVGEETDFGVTGAHDMAVSADGRLVAASSGASTVRLWDISNTRHPVQMSSLDAGNNLALSPDGHMLATVGKSVTLWSITDPTRPTVAATLPQYTLHAAAMAFTPDSRILAVYYNGAVLVYDVTDPAAPRQLTPPPRRPTNDSNHDFAQSRFSPDGRLLAIEVGEPAQVTLWSLADRTAPRRLTTIVFGHDVLPYGDLAFSPDSATLATGTARGHLTLWNITDPVNPAVLSTMDDVPIGPDVTGVSGPEIALAFSPDGHALSSVMGSVKSTRWDVTDRTRCRHLDDRSRNDAGPGQFRLTPDGQAVVGAAHGADTVSVWTIG